MGCRCGMKGLSQCASDLGTLPSCAAYTQNAIQQQNGIVGVLRTIADCLEETLVDPLAYVASDYISRLQQPATTRTESAAQNIGEQAGLTQSRQTNYAREDKEYHRRIEEEEERRRQ